MKSQPDVLVGLVRARLQPVRAAEDRRVDPVAREVAPARRHERRGAQDSRPQPDDHRPIRRGAGRVRAGHPLQARLGGDALQPWQAVFDPGQLGAGAQGVRGGAAHRSAVRRSASTRWGSRWRRSATTRARSRRTRRPSRSTTSARAGSPAPHVNLSAYYNRTGNPDKALEYATKALELDPKSDRRAVQKARADERQGRLDDAVDALNRAIALNPRASSYYYVLAGVYRRLGLDGREREGARVFKRLDRESNELDKKRRPWRAAAATAGAGRARVSSARPHDPRAAGSCGCWAARSACAAAVGTRAAARAVADRRAERTSVRCFTDVTSRAGLLARAERLGQPATTSSSCSRRWAAASRSSITTTTAGSTSFS